MNKEKNRLDSIRPKQPNYPDAEFFERMAEHVIAEHSSPFIKTPFYQKPVVRWIAAAAVLIPFVLIFVLNSPFASRTTLFAELDKIPHESIREYVAEQEPESMFLAFGTVSSKENSVKKTVDQLTTGITIEEISNYLLEEDDGWDNEEAYLFY